MKLQDWSYFGHDPYGILLLQGVEIIATYVDYVSLHTFPPHVLVVSSDFVLVYIVDGVSASISRVNFILLSSSGMTCVT